jgi:hypothetical protein
MRFKESSINVLKKEDDLLQARFAEENPWGLSMAVDLYECELALLKDEKKIKQFLCTRQKLFHVDASA